MSTELPVNLRHLEGTDNRNIEMVVVIPVARCEWHLAVKLLRWLDAMDGYRGYPFVVLCAPGVKESEREELEDVAQWAKVVETDYKDTGYFGGANASFKAALEYCEKHHAGKAMLWCESDCVPLRATWVDEILDEYRWSGCFFMGDVHLCAIDHMTGNAVWSPHWRRIAPSLAALPGPDPEWGWDSSCASDTLTRAHRARTIQQIWRPPLPITEAWAAANIRPDTALFHQQKDGSLIDVLCAKAGLPLIPLPAQLEESTYAKGRQTPENPALVAKLSPQQRMIAGMNSSPVPRIGILIVTCAKHMDYVKNAIKSIDKFASGFSEIVIAVEEGEREQFNWIKRHRIHVYRPANPDKPMLSHQVVKCRADEILTNSDAILYFDSDLMFWRPVTPEAFVADGKLRATRERYADLKNPLRKNWQKAVETSLGFKPEYEGMVCHGIVHWRETLIALRKSVEAHTGMAFDEHFTSGQDHFQQQVAEFDSMIAIALRDFRHRYSPVDYDWVKDCKELGIPDTSSHQYAYRRDRDYLVEFWGHSPFSRYKSDAEAFFAGRIPQYYLK